LLDALQGPIEQMVTSGYSRQAEREADQNVLKVYQQLGYDPHKASHFFRTMLEIMPKDTTATTSLFSTYPGTVERIEAIDAARHHGGPGGVVQSEASRSCRSSSRRAILPAPRRSPGRLASFPPRALLCPVGWKRRGCHACKTHSFPLRVEARARG
jgi:predicted Zn-dependent protease